MLNRILLIMVWDRLVYGHLKKNNQNLTFQYIRIIFLNQSKRKK